MSGETKQRLLQSAVLGGAAGAIAVTIGQLFMPLLRLPQVGGAIMIAVVLVSYLVLDLRNRAKRRTPGSTGEKPQAADETVPEAAMVWTFAEGRITRAQADQIAADRALQKNIADKGVLRAAVESAVKDGVITRAQADQILSRPHGSTTGPP